MNKEKSIEALNKLIEINNDRIEGYNTALSATKEPDLKTLFSQFILTSEKCNIELANEVQKLGGKPIEGTKITGKFFRAWMDVKSALTKNDRQTILSSCETGEDVAVDTYYKVLRNDIESITAEQQKMINAQFALIKADHDKVKSMRDALVSVK
jgi:uncharacterized protein (TIGR02284 family)